MRNLIYFNNFTANRQIAAIACFTLVSVLPMRATTITGELGSAGPGFWAIVTNSNNPHLNGPGTTNGNVAVTNPGTTLFLDSSLGTAVNGNVAMAPGGTVSHPLQVTGSISTNLSSNVLSDASAAETYFAGLAATNTLTSLSSTPTITSAPGATNVFHITDGNLGGNTLTLSGDANSQFIFDITAGDLRLNSGHINLMGGLLPSDVLFNVENGDLSTSGGLMQESVINGIVLVSTGNVNMSPGRINGELISLSTGTFQIVSGGNVDSTSVTPEPQSYSIAGLGLLILAGGAWRRKARRASRS